MCLFVITNLSISYQNSSHLYIYKCTHASRIIQWEKLFPPNLTPNRPEFCQKRCILLYPFAFNCSCTVCELSLYLLSTTTLHFLCIILFLSLFGSKRNIQVNQHSWMLYKIECVHLHNNYKETQQCKWKKKKNLHKPYKRCLANIKLYLLKPSLKFCNQQNCNKAAAKFIIQQQLKNLTGKQGGKKREVKKPMHALKAL